MPSRATPASTLVWSATCPPQAHIHRECSCWGVHGVGAGCSDGDRCCWVTHRGGRKQAHGHLPTKCGDGVGCTCTWGSSWVAHLARERSPPRNQAPKLDATAQETRPPSPCRSSSPTNSGASSASVVATASTGSFHRIKNATRWHTCHVTAPTCAPHAHTSSGQRARGIHFHGPAPNTIPLEGTRGPWVARSSPRQGQQ